MTDAPSTPPPPAPIPAQRGFWRRTPVILACTVGLAFLTHLSLDLLVDNQTRESTDDAFLDAEVVAIAPRVQGQVAAIHVQNNQTVKPGDLLLELDPADLKVTLEQRRAVLESAQANNELLKAGLGLTRAAVASAEATAKQTAAEAVASEAMSARAAADLRRARDLIANHTISPQEFDAIEAAAKAAEASLRAAREKAASDRSKVAQAEAEVATAIKAFARAEAQTRQSEWDVKAAELNLSYVRITAPTNGFITKKMVVAGDYVQVGQHLLALVPDKFYVTANFKETQIRRIRPGQKALVEIDSISHQPIPGHVDSIMAGSGASFSLLPPENAVGNYVKVVQRIPVKILLDGPVDGGHVLGPGMSAVPSVQVSDFSASPALLWGGSAAVALVVGGIWLATTRKP